MHINNDRLIDSLTEIELLHIESCVDCKNERQKLMALKTSANQLELLIPDERVWQDIKFQQIIKTKKTKGNNAFIFASASSFFCISIGWLTWTNYSLQKQLEQVLFVNKTLEIQLVEGSVPSLQQAQLLSEIHSIDLQLMKAITIEEKLLILQQRQKLMAEMVINLQGNNYDYSI